MLIICIFPIYYIVTVSHNSLWDRKDIKKWENQIAKNINKK